MRTSAGTLVPSRRCDPGASAISQTYTQLIDWRSHAMVLQDAAHAKMIPFQS
jgi:hypothetical protein